MKAGPTGWGYTWNFTVPPTDLPDDGEFSVITDALSHGSGSLYDGKYALVAHRMDMVVHATCEHGNQIDLSRLGYAYVHGRPEGNKRVPLARFPITPAEPPWRAASN